MRIISGKRRGYKLQAPSGDSTRPTTDRVKESLFNIIQMRFPCGSVLDLFAGSGALGIEALSRGAEHAVFAERDREAYQTVLKNLTGSGLKGSAELFMNDAFELLAELSGKRSFDMIFLDPPYNRGLLNKALGMISDCGLLADGGIIVAETEAGGEEPADVGFEIIKTAKYGKTVITVMQR